MGIYKNIRFYQVKDLRKGATVLCIGFDKVPVQVVIPRIAPEAVYFRAILVNPGLLAPVQSPPRYCRPEW